MENSLNRKSLERKTIRILFSPIAEWQTFITTYFLYVLQKTSSQQKMLDRLYYEKRIIPSVEKRGYEIENNFTKCEESGTIQGYC